MCRYNVQKIFNLQYKTSIIMSKYLCRSVGNILYLLAKHVHDISQIDQIQAKPKPTVLLNP